MTQGNCEVIIEKLQKHYGDYSLQEFRERGQFHYAECPQEHRCPTHTSTERLGAGGGSQLWWEGACPGQPSRKASWEASGPTLQRTQPSPPANQMCL